MKFNDAPSDDIKFHDFFLSMNNDREPMILKESIDLNSINNVLSSYKKGEIDLNMLLKVCPFNLKANVMIVR